MPKVSKKTATKGGDHGPVSEWFEDYAGQTVSWVQFKQNIDATPLLKGCRDDRCQCPHWGYVLKGKFTMRYADREEVYETGDAFYTPPGHVPVAHEPGTELLMISPTPELRETEAVLKKNLDAMMKR